MFQSGFYLDILAHVSSDPDKELSVPFVPENEITPRFFEFHSTLNLRMPPFSLKI